MTFIRTSLTALSLAGIAAAAVTSFTPTFTATSSADQSGRSTAPAFDPAHFTHPVDNPYFPLTPGLLTRLHGSDGDERFVEKVRVTHRTVMIAGVRAVVVRDVVRRPDGTLAEATDDWYADDDQGNVWYLGEDTVHFLAHGKADTSGSWEAGVNGAVPGIIMEANPQIPDAYRQELLAGEAEDTAWIVDRGTTIRVPYGRVTNVLTTLEATRLEPGAYDQKVYGPGIGIVLEQSLSGDPEYAKLESVTGP
jgi:hypothetical protein